MRTMLLRFSSAQRRKCSRVGDDAVDAAKAAFDFGGTEPKDRVSRRGQLGASKSIKVGKQKRFLSIESNPFAISCTGVITLKCLNFFYFYEQRKAYHQRLSRGREKRCQIIDVLLRMTGAETQQSPSASVVDPISGSISRWNKGPAGARARTLPQFKFSLQSRERDDIPLLFRIDKSSRGVSRIDEATPWDACPYA